MGRIQSLQGILMFLVPISPNINRTVGAPPRLLCDLACEIAPASENTQGSGDSVFLLANAP
jgi:hypothetical protein